jgi:hypothetical protein
LTLVRPGRTRKLISRGFLSTMLEKSPPWHRRRDPSLSLSWAAATWRVFGVLKREGLLLACCCAGLARGARRG